MKKSAMKSEGTINKLEKKMVVLESLVRNLLNKQKCKVTPEEEPASIMDCTNVSQLLNVQEGHVSS